MKTICRRSTNMRSRLAPARRNRPRLALEDFPLRVVAPAYLLSELTTALIDRILRLFAIFGDRPGGLVGPGGDGALHASARPGGDADQADRVCSGRRLALDRDHVAVELRAGRSVNSNRTEPPA